MFWSSPPTTFSSTLPNARKLVKPDTWFPFDPNLLYLFKKTAKNTFWTPTCWQAGLRCGCPAEIRGFCCASALCWGGGAALCVREAAGCRGALAGDASWMVELWVGWKCVRGAGTCELKASGRDPWEGLRCACTTRAPRAWVPLTPSRSGDEGRLRKGLMEWSEWRKDGREARGCEVAVESPSLRADLQSVESRCPSAWVQKARSCRLPSAHLLHHRRKKHQHYKTWGEYQAAHVLTEESLNVPHTWFSGALQTGEGSNQPGTFLRAGAESSHRVPHLSTCHLQ